MNGVVDSNICFTSAIRLKPIVDHTENSKVIKNFSVDSTRKKTTILKYPNKIVSPRQLN